MKRVNLFVMGVIVFMLASCNFPNVFQTETPMASPTLLPSTPTVIPTNTPEPYTPPEHRIGIRVENGMGEYYNRVTNEKFIPRGMNYVHLGPQTNPYGRIHYLPRGLRPR